MEELRRTNTTIPPTWTEDEVETKANAILESEPMRSLMREGGEGSFYILFAREDRHHEERHSFLTPRGGKSKRRLTRGQTSKRSRPILLKQDGGFISPSDLWGSSGFLFATLDEGRNPINYIALEKRLHEKTKHLPLGRRLHRKCGGGHYKADAVAMKYGVYLTYHPDGYPSRYVLNE